MNNYTKSYHKVITAFGGKTDDLESKNCRAMSDVRCKRIKERRVKLAIGKNVQSMTNALNLD